MNGRSDPDDADNLVYTLYILIKLMENKLLQHHSQISLSKQLMLPWMLEIPTTGELKLRMEKTVATQLFGLLKQNSC